VAITTLATILLTLPLGVGASSDKRFVLGLDGTLSGSSGTASWTSAGAISDTGTASSAFTVLGQKGNCFSIVGDNTYTATDGSFTEHIAGSNCFTNNPDDPRGIFDGRFTITSGTGRYSGLAGSGTITGEDDTLANTFTSIYDGHVTPEH
jgi:hypothetical protein